MQQDAAINILLNAAKNDAAVQAVFLKGSFGRDEADHYSDIDFYCLVDENQLNDFLLRRRDILRQYRPLLFSTDVNFVAPQVVAVFNDGIHVDFYTVTLKNFPQTDCIRVLHDPHQLLNGYHPQPFTISFEYVLDRFNSFIFTLMEFEVAYRRGHAIWAMRLADNLPADWAFVYRYLHDPSRAGWALKHIDQVIDETTGACLCRAMSAPLPDNISLYVNLMAQVANQYPPHQREQFNWEFFNFMHQRLQIV